MFDAAELVGLSELTAAVETHSVIKAKFADGDSRENDSMAMGVNPYAMAMVPLVLADRYVSSSYGAIYPRTLMRLYIPQERYLLGAELRGDIIIPMMGSRIAKGFRFAEFSLVKSTPTMRSIFRSAQDINPMDALTLSRFYSALVMRNIPIDASGHGYYFGAGPNSDGYDLIERFFDALNIARPLGSWFVQLAVKPRGWIGYFEQPHGSIFCFMFRNHISRIVNRLASIPN